ncbi:putative MFS family arabinose efflux permease [Streptomyces sp. 2132.2]|uniref:MFS transporter n=1 Tax=Streptomyces sp. 2132.2 TaxID=2485161 RepID=UPI000C181EBD|nr:MFS transporter [Streptomyces sp. 2132.2]ROQ99352.1 putative MFS family arabinose efflux permease [Streptomyces sp. 2132.2]
MNAWREASPTARLLLIAVLFTGLTTFMFLPLLAIELTAQGIPAGRTGFLVGLLAFSGQAFSLLTGLLVDRFGARRVMAAGFLLRVLGYVLLGLGGAGAPAPLVAGIAAVGVGGSLLGLSTKTLLVSQEGADPRTMLALRSTFVNVGVVAGPALGAAVYPLGFGWILAACVLSHLVLGTCLVLRRSVTASRSRPAAGRAPAPAADGAPAAPWTLRQWLPLCGLGVAYWAIYSQLNVLLPITANEMTGSAAAISVVFTANGLLVVLFQYTLLRHVFRRATARTLLVLGFLAFACAYATLIPLAGWYSLLAFVVPVTLAEMLIGPSLDEQAVSAAATRRTGLALGTMSAAGALGSLFGSSAGGYLLQSARGGSEVWLLLVGSSLAAAAICLLLPKVRTRHV